MGTATGSTASGLLRRHVLAAAAGAVFLTAPAQARSPRVVTTTTDLAAVAREVARDLAKVESLAQPFQNPHFVDAKPSLVLKLMKADLFVLTGLDLEIGWAPLLVKGSRNRNIQRGAAGYVDASQAVSPIEIPAKLSRAEGDVHPGGNPHYLQDPENAVKVARLLAAKLGEADGENHGAYAKNADAFAAKVRDKLAVWTKKLAPAKGAPAVVYHRNWSYFAERFGLELVGEIEPKPGIPPTGAHTAALMETMKARGVRIILTEPWFEERTPAKLAESSGAKVLPMALVPGARKGTATYFDWMDYNVRMLKNGLARE